MNEVTKRLPSNRLVYYRLKMFDILVKAAEAKPKRVRYLKRIKKILSIKQKVIIMKVLLSSVGGAELFRQMC